MTELTPKQAAAFWERVDQSRGPDACWPWLGKTVDGYGRYALLTSHRVTYEAMVGPIPEGMTLDHVCHTKDATCPGGQACQHRRCVNPAHLEPVTSVHAAGWTLARSSEREALVAALAGTAGHANVGGLPCWCSKWAEHPMDASRHEDYCQMARAAIEGGR